VTRPRSEATVVVDTEERDVRLNRRRDRVLVWHELIQAGRQPQCPGHVSSHAQAGVTGRQRPRVLVFQRAAHPRRIEGPVREVRAQRRTHLELPSLERLVHPVVGGRQLGDEASLVVLAVEIDDLVAPLETCPDERKRQATPVGSLREPATSVLAGPDGHCEVGPDGDCGVGPDCHCERAVGLKSSLARL
jgi:hypothetical protein